MGDWLENWTSFVSSCRWVKGWVGPWTIAALIDFRLCLAREELRRDHSQLHFLGGSNSSGQGVIIYTLLAGPARGIVRGSPSSLVQDTLRHH